MAEASKTEKANPVPYQGDHDRVAGLSVKADGTLDQHNPEIIIDKDAALELTRVQFAQQAVSAVDVHERGVSTGTEEDAPQDPSIAELKDKHDAAAKSAESAADKAVSFLVKD